VVFQWCDTLGAFTVLQKKDISFIMSVSPSAWNNLAPTGWIFKKFYVSTSRKSVKKIHVWLKSDTNNKYFTWRPKCQYDNKIKKHISCLITFFFENPAIFEIMSKNIVQPGRPQMTIWCMSFSGWITKATNTHSGYIIIISFPLQQWLHERTSVLCGMYNASPVQTGTSI